MVSSVFRGRCGYSRVLTNPVDMGYPHCSCYTCHHHRMINRPPFNVEHLPQRIGTDNELPNLDISGSPIMADRLFAHGAANRGPRPLRLQRVNLRFLEGANPAQHRQAAICGYAGGYKAKPESSCNDMKPAHGRILAGIAVVYKLARPTY